ncbi:MAG: hypothetical protein V2I33_23960 [Kangiellaceae bacterium]|jgi:hypothetical protein|nr:hypothetical protein [Kangiellaceae bacterium]
MKAELNDHQWPHPSEMDINNLNDHLRTTLIDIQEKYVSSKGISGPRKHKPYQLTLEEQKAIKCEHKTWKKYSRTCGIRTSENPREIVRIPSRGCSPLPGELALKTSLALVTK